MRPTTTTISNAIAIETRHPKPGLVGPPSPGSVESRDREANSGQNPGRGLRQTNQARGCDEREFAHW